MSLITCACYVVKFADPVNFLSVPFKEEELCNAQPCDNTSTNCTSEEGFYSCTCKENFLNTTLSDRLCVGKEV